MSTYTFSYYNGPIKNVKPSKAITLHDAMDLIRSDRFKEDIQRLRNADNKDVQKTLKNSLPYLTFSGTFTKRLTESLKKHSGLICVDLDPYKKVNNEQVLINPRLLEEFDTVKDELLQIDWVCAVFVSPSGTGYKVVIKIPEAHHDASFEQLKVFFADKLFLELDKGVRDIARACFVSWDPDLYYNPSSNVFPVEIKEPVPAPIANTPAKVDQSDFDKQLLMNKELLRVKYVVEQIEEKQLDITGDYDDWQMIAFALSTLGEEAREFFHRIAKFHSEYNEQYTNEKFTDALNGRERDEEGNAIESKAKKKIHKPTKFFSIAKDNGLDVKLPRTVEEAKKAADARVTIGDQTAFDEFEKYGIYLDRKNNVYISLDTKGVKRVITNFSLRILYHISTGADEAYRLMQIKNIHGLEKILRINTDDFVMAGSFKKIIARLGNFIFKGADSDLVRLQDMLQRHEVHTENVETLGWNKRHKFYAFANGLFDTIENDFLPIDNYGIVEKVINGKNINFFIPALSSVFRDKEDKYVNEKKFIYIDSPVKYNDWATQYVKVFGENGRVGLVYWACALFSDILFKAMGLRMPMPFSYGKRGSGKGTMTQSLTRMWGEKQDQIMLGGATTVVGFMRKMAQFCNGLVWLDEYKNSLPIKTIESIKNLFDRIGYERGKKDNSFTTESTPILSAVWLSGQEMPTIEPALFTRTILLTFSETNRTEEAREEFRKLQRMEDQGLSHLTMNMLKNRSQFEQDYQQIYESTLRDFSNEINNRDIDERLLGNYSMLLATAKILENLNMLPFPLTAFRNQCKELLLQQYYILKGSDDTSKFWQVIEQLVGSYIIKENDHYLLANGFIYIYIQDVYHHYVKAMNDRREMNILDKPTLENYLKSDTKSFVARTKKTIGQKYSWAFQFKYNALDIDLIRGIDETDIRQKYVAMGLEYKKEGEVMEDGFPVVEQKKINF